MDTINQKVQSVGIPVRMRNRPVSAKGLWKSVPGLPFVEASSDGRVRTLDHTTLMIQKDRTFLVTRRGRILKQMRNRKGYYRLTLSVLMADGKHKQRCFFVHKLVCLAFHGLPPPDKPWALHKDGYPSRNSDDNLYWGNPSDNMYDRVAHGHAARPNAKLSFEEATEIRARYNPRTESTKRLLSAEYGVSVWTISNVVYGKAWQ